MMKKMTSMLLALAMCLTLSVPAFAAEEEPELTDEPAVQTEVETVAEEEVAAPTEAETEPADEPAAQAEAAHIHVYVVSNANYIDSTDYTVSGHAYIERHLHKCKYCDEMFYEEHGKTYKPHSFRVTELGTTIGGNGETITTYQYQCRSCNYYYVTTR